MYAHLIRQNDEPVSTAGYKFRRRCRFTYGSLGINAEVRFPELAEEGQLELTIYSSDKRAMLMHGQLPKRPRAGGELCDENELLELIMPKADISYLLSLFGVRRGGYETCDVRRVKTELPEGRKYKWYERHELHIAQQIDLPWLKLYSAVFEQGG